MQFLNEKAPLAALNSTRHRLDTSLDTPQDNELSVS